MRPDEWARTCAWAWMEASAVRQAIEDGVAEARAERQAAERASAMLAGMRTKGAAA